MSERSRVRAAWQTTREKGIFMLADPRQRRSYRQVADLILSLITGQGLVSGDRLPAERDLADRLGVSRPSLREALIALEVEGRVDIRMGSGVYVAGGVAGVPADAALVDGEGPFEILEARGIIESAIAEEAARRVSQALIDRLDANLDAMAGLSHDGTLSIKLDGEFHVSIAEGTGNPLLIHLTSETFNKRLTPLFTRLASHIEQPQSWRRALAEHRQIRDAIAANDPAAAHEAMRRHLMNSHKRFSANFTDAGELLAD